VANDIPAHASCVSDILLLPGHHTVLNFITKLLIRWWIPCHWDIYWW